MYKNLAFIVGILLSVFLLVESASADGGVTLSRASNPECSLADTVAMGGAIALGVGIGLAIPGFYMATFVGSPDPIGAAVARVINGIGTNMVIIAAVGIATGLASFPMFFACNWSFVRHPVLRYEFDDNDAGVKKGTYRECAQYDKLPIACMNANYRDAVSYAKCIKDYATAQGIANPSTAQIFDNEPHCTSKTYQVASEYYWPKNRTQRSNFIELCYRPALTIAAMVQPLGLLVQIPDGLIQGEDGLDPRELDFGTGALHFFKYLLGSSSSIGKLSSVKSAPLCVVLEPDKTWQKHGIDYIAEEEAGNICVKIKGINGHIWFPTPTIGCHQRDQGPPAPMCSASVAIRDTTTKKVVKYDNAGCFNCFIDNACTGDAGSHSLALFPFTSTIIECIRGSLRNMITGTCKVGGVVTQRKGFLMVVQERMQRGINALLVLSLMLFALKGLMGGLHSHVEVILLVIKYAAVLAFTNGDMMGHYYNDLMDLSIGLSDLVLSAGGNQTICNFQQSDFAPGYGYLAPWTRLDCRAQFYLGGQLNGKTIGLMFSTILLAAFLIFFIIFGQQVLVALGAIFFTTMFIIVMLWMSYLFVMSMVALTLLILLAPIFIPTVLFQVTKNIFDGWLRELMTYSLYPVMLFSFLSLTMTVWDNLFFDDLQFIPSDESVGTTKGIKRTYKLKDPNACADDKHMSNLACMLSDVKMKDYDFIFGATISGPELRAAVLQDVWKKLAIMALMGFLFYHFLTVIGGIAAELAGNARADLSRAVTSPAAIGKNVLGKLMSLRSKAGNLASSGGKYAIGKARDAIEKRRGGGGDSIIGGTGD